MTNWLDMCRLCVADIQDVLERLPTRVEREPVLRVGEGGDDTTAIDQAAEDAVVTRLVALGEDFVLVSEELGERMFGDGGARRVVVDPIDGQNASAESFFVHAAVADAPTMAT
jgi:fructose-1,6-bisphosphatase/inositol monophosphatase family enzyme